MRQASVGFHCPECSKAAPSKVISGSQLIHRREQPIVTNVLIAMNLAVFVLQLVSGTGFDGSMSDFDVDYALLGAGVTPDQLLVGVSQGEWYRVFTGTFLHGGFIHIAFNMYALYILGPQIERALGHLEFVGIYVVALLAGSFGALLITPFDPTVGASGAIYGLLGAAVVLQKRNGIDPWSSGIIGLLAINLLLTFAIPGISIGGHLGGLVGGALAGLVILESQQRRQPIIAAVGCTGLGIGFFLGAIWAAEQAFANLAPVIDF